MPLPSPYAHVLHEIDLDCVLQLYEYSFLIMFGRYCLIIHDLFELRVVAVFHKPYDKCWFCL